MGPAAAATAGSRASFPGEGYGAEGGYAGVDSNPHQGAPQYQTHHDLLAQQQQQQQQLAAVQMAQMAQLQHQMGGAGGMGLPSGAPGLGGHQRGLGSSGALDQMAAMGLGVPSPSVMAAMQQGGGAHAAAAMMGNLGAAQRVGGALGALRARRGSRRSAGDGGGVSGGVRGGVLRAAAAAPAASRLQANGGGLNQAALAAAAAAGLLGGGPGPGGYAAPQQGLGAYGRAPARAGLRAGPRDDDGGVHQASFGGAGNRGAPPGCIIRARGGAAADLAGPRAEGRARGSIARRRRRRRRPSGASRGSAGRRRRRGAPLRADSAAAADTTRTLPTRRRLS